MLRHARYDPRVLRHARYETDSDMKQSTSATNSRSGKVGWLLLWLLGVPIPLLLILFLLRGCT